MKHKLPAEFLRQICGIIGLRIDPREKRQLLRGYTDLMWQYVKKVKLRRDGAKVIRLMGLIIEFPDWETVRVTFREIFIERSYDITLTNSRPVIIDCGSNMGMSIVFFKKRYPSAHIIGFEPDPETFQCLANNVSRNFKDVTVHNLALSDQSGWITLSGESDRDNSTIKTTVRGMLENVPTSSHQVRAGRLSEFLTGKIDLLKLDVEGSEGAILSDLIVSGKLSLVERMVVEHHNLPGDAQHHLPSFLKTLEDQGFSYSLYGPVHSLPEKFPPYPPRAVFVYAVRDSV